MDALRRPVQELSARVAEINSIAINHTRLRRVRLVVNNTRVGPRRRDGGERQALEEWEFAVQAKRRSATSEGEGGERSEPPKSLKLVGSFRLRDTVSGLKALLEPGEVAREGDAVADVALAETFDLGWGLEYRVSFVGCVVGRDEESKTNWHS